MNFLKMYFRQKKAALLFFFLSVFVFAFVFFLYDLPLGAVLYPAFICAVLAVFFLGWDIYRAKRKHHKLERLSHLTADLPESFPKVTTQDDVDYQRIIASMQQEQRELQTKMNLRYQDMMDYYTIWVHQIKTPIAAMRLTLQNQDSALSRQLSEDLQRIEQYVEMVLAFLRLGADTKDYVFKEHDLDLIIKEAVRKFAGQFIRKKLRLCYEPLNIRVLTDEKWLAFVIEQVLSNAVKYTPSGSISITLEPPCTLCIRDTGIGIAPEDLPRVFEKSYTGYNGRTDKKASGIGLYLCRQICNNLGHTITISSSMDRGTVVKICLAHENLEVE